MNDDVLDVLAIATGRALKSAGAMLATAESCTGGWVAALVTSVPGSSAWFDRGFVTYTNESKEELLGVVSATLLTHGAVSEPTAREMAEGALARSRADIALAITGVAGPSGGSPAKPVGMVCFGWARRGSRAESTTCHFAGDRTAVRRQAVVFALEGVTARLAGGPSSGAR